MTVLLETVRLGGNSDSIVHYVQNNSANFVDGIAITQLGSGTQFRLNTRAFGGVKSNRPHIDGWIIEN